jgi:hypothetical protein
MEAIEILTNVFSFFTTWFISCMVGIYQAQDRRGRPRRDVAYWIAVAEVILFPVLVVTLSVQGRGSQFKRLLPDRPRAAGG